MRSYMWNSSHVNITLHTCVHHINEIWAHSCFDLEHLHKESIAANLSILSVSPETKYETCNHFQHILNCSSIIISAMHGFCCDVHKVCHHTVVFSAHFTHSSYTRLYTNMALPTSPSLGKSGKWGYKNSVDVIQLDSQKLQLNAMQLVRVFYNKNPITLTRNP